VTALGDDLDDIVRAQRHHLRLVRRFGSSAAYKRRADRVPVLRAPRTDRPDDSSDAGHHWTRRTEHLIPPGSEAATFSASRLFAAVYPEAVDLVALVVLVASPAWRPGHLEIATLT
jgi:hypothetical protein